MRLVGVLVTAALLTIPAGASTTPLHFSLLRSVPSKDQKLDVPPPRLQLWFSQAPAAVVSQISLKREVREMPLSKTIVDDKEKSMYADPVKPLEAGAYTLTWRAAGDDGHVLSGEVKFTIERSADRNSAEHGAMPLNWASVLLAACRWLTYAAVLAMVGSAGARFVTARVRFEQFRAVRRSEERRVGKECGYQCRSRWSPYH